MIKKVGVIFLFLLCLAAEAQTLVFSTEVMNAYRDAFRLDRAGMEHEIRKEKVSNPANILPHVIESYFDFIQVFVREEKALHDKFQQQKRIRLEKIAAVSDTNALKLWSQATIYLQSAAERTKFGEHYSAAFELRKAFLLLTQNRIKFPELLLNELPYGLLYALTGSVPPQYQWVVRLVSMEGDVDKGKQMLYDLLQKSESDQLAQLIRPEVLFYLSFLEMTLNPDKESTVLLVRSFEDSDCASPLMIYARANIEMRSGKNEAALKTLSRRHGHQHASEAHFYYLDFLEAEARLRQLDYSAGEIYNRFLTRFRGINYKADARRKLAWISLLQGDEQAYHQQMSKLTTIEGLQVESDKQAVREATQGVAPHEYLLKARLLFDGGYYSRAREILYKAGLNQAELSVDENLEYWYRMGRVFQALGNESEALKYYSLTIRSGKSSPLYFAANAALFSAEMLEQQGRFPEAHMMFKTCLSFRPEEYRNGIHARAQAGLKRIEKNIP